MLTSFLRLNWLLLLTTLLVPCAAWWSLFSPPDDPLQLEDYASRFDSSPLAFTRYDVGTPAEHVPQITHVQLVDLDGDTQPEILACDAISNTIVRAKKSETGVWVESNLLPPHRFSDPAHVTAVDIDHDQDLDLLVSVLGSVIPDDSKSGAVVLLLNDGQGQFEEQVVLSQLRRVTDIQAGDLDGDGDLDLVVAEFGYNHGRILWLENQGGLKFRDRELMVVPGAIHVPLSDFDGDGDLDIAANITQDEEEVWLLENLGTAQFQPRPIYTTSNFDLGGSGLMATDLDQDGDQDLLMIAGDNLELVYHYPQPYHGCWWLENRGQLHFVAQQIGALGGVYAVATGDLDGDGDIDVALGSMFNDWRAPGTAALVWLENNGQQQFKTWQIDDGPAHLCTLAIGDVNGDGTNEIIGGALHTYEPYHRMGRIVAWMRASTQEQP